MNMEGCPGCITFWEPIKIRTVIPLDATDFYHICDSDNKKAEIKVEKQFSRNDLDLEQ